MENIWTWWKGLSWGHCSDCSRPKERLAACLALYHWSAVRYRQPGMYHDSLIKNSDIYNIWEIYTYWKIWEVQYQKLKKKKNWPGPLSVINRWDSGRRGKIPAARFRELLRNLLVHPSLRYVSYLRNQNSDSKVNILRTLLISSGDMFSKLAAAPKDDKVNAHPIGDPHTSGSKWRLLGTNIEISIYLL